MVAARAARNDGDGQAQRARGLDLQLLRRLRFPTTCSGSGTRTTPSAASTRHRATAARTIRWAPSTRAASGTGPIPTPNDITWGPRANVNMQQSALLISMNNVAKNKELFLENYYVKNKHAIERGQTKAPHAYVVPAAQRRKVEAAELMNLLRREGAEVHTANAAFTAGNVAVAAGDYVVRMDQPLRRGRGNGDGPAVLPAGEPASVQRHGMGDYIVRNVKSTAVADKSILQQPMTLASADFKVPGTITGTGPVIVVDHTTDNTLVTFRFQHAGREDGGGGTGVRARRPQVRHRRVCHRQRGPRRARAVDQGAGPLRMGGGRGPGGADPQSRRAEDRLHPHLDQHAGRRLGPGVQPTSRCPTPTSPTTSCARAT